MHIDPYTYWLAALFLMVFPLKWLLSAVAAAAFHEFCHLLTVKLLGGEVRFLRLSPAGMVMDIQLSNYSQELLAAIAGPAGSIFLALAGRRSPEIAVCAAVQAIYNLLPIYPLDGGRVIDCLLKLTAPQKARQIRIAIEKVFCAIVIAFGLWAGSVSSLGWIPLWMGLLLILRANSRKRPCKQGRIRVQ